MRRLLPAVFACCLWTAGAPAGPADALAAIRTDVTRALERGAGAGERDALASRIFAFAEQAESRSRFWSAMALAADLCAAGPHRSARVWRARALTLLADRCADANRWSALVTLRFMPPLADIPRDEWGEEIATYDAMLDRLGAAATDPRVESELLCAKAMLTVHVNRHWDWMDHGRRRKAIRDLEAIEERLGDLPAPGSASAPGRTVGARAARHASELATMHFGAEAPPLTGADLEGQPIDLADHRGRVVVLDFWTSFCRPCLALVPHTRAMLDDLDGEPITIIGVCGDQDRALGRRSAARTGMTWPSVWDQRPDGPVASAYHVPSLGWPSVFVIDAKGRIRYKLYGYEEVDRHLERAVRTLLDEAASVPTTSEDPQ